MSQYGSAHISNLHLTGSGWNIPAGEDSKA